MSQKKRHLSNRQQKNMQEHRATKLKKLNKAQACQQELEQRLSQEANSLQLLKGIVISRYGKQADVMPVGENDSFTNDSIRCYMKASLEDLVVGDTVYFYQVNDEQYFIIEMEERKNLITRYYFNKERNIVSNVSTMIITSSLNPTLNTEIIDRYLIVAENAHIKPLILINKIDLIEDQEQEQEVDHIIATYNNLGYQTLKVSAQTGENVALIQQQLQTGMHIFVGQTGVGKSSLLNAIFGTEMMAVGEINEDTRLGKHTTTTSRLFKINNHCALIDSPGIREFSIENYSVDQIIKGYKELHASEYICRFSDCNHHNNLGCGIAKCLEDGKIADFRYQNLNHLLELAQADGK